MGRDKALLPAHGRTLAEAVAGVVSGAAGPTALVGGSRRILSVEFGYLPDLYPGDGPLGGILTALENSAADWNLIVACDMPGLTTGFLEDLFLAAEATEADCVVPEGARGVEPLCAVYHRRCRTHAASAIARKKLKMHDFVSSLHAVTLPVSDFSPLRNANTPEEWANR